MLSYYLGIEVNQSKDGILIQQTNYAEKLLKVAGMQECNETHIPMDPGLKLGKMEGGISVDPAEYRKYIGSLRYLTHTRPDLMYPVGYLSRFMQDPKDFHMKAVKQVLRYLRGTRTYGVRYKSGIKAGLIGYSDSDYSNCDGDRKDTTGHVFYFNDSPVSWCSQKQSTVALSSCEA